MSGKPISCLSTVYSRTSPRRGTPVGRGSIQVRPIHLKGRIFSSRDVAEVARLSLYQQNHWDARGVLPHARSGEAGWRKFSIREVFALAISVEIRHRFAVPLERLKWVQYCMLDEDVDHLKAAVDLMANLGVRVWLLTDFDDSFIMDAEPELQDLWNHGFLAAHNKSGFVLLNVSRLVNRVLSCLKDPALLEAQGYSNEAVQKIRSLVGTESPEKVDVLRVRRNRELRPDRSHRDRRPAQDDSDHHPAG